MAMTAAPQCGIFGAASGVMLHGDTRPLIHGVGLSAHDNAVLAGSLGDGSNARQAAQCGLIAPVQCVAGFCEQRGEDDPSYSWQGGEDLRVVLFRPGFGGRSEACCQDIELTMRLLELPIHKADAFNKAGDVSAIFEAPDTITLQELGNSRLADAPRFAGRGREFPEVEQPGGGRAWLESNAKVHTVCEPVAFGAQIIGEARPLAQVDNGCCASRLCKLRQERQKPPGG